MSNRQLRATMHDAPKPATAEARAAASTQPTDDVAPPAEYMQIEQVATRTGLTKRALRYYEEIGLLDRPTRTEGNYRLYSERDVARVESIKRWREFLGFSLAEIRELVGMEEERQQARDDWAHANGPRERLALLNRTDDLARHTLTVVQGKIAGLEAIHTELNERLERHALRRVELQAEAAQE